MDGKIDIHQYDGLLARKRQEEADKKVSDNKNAKIRLKAIAKKKIQTTMIGALSSIEKHFEFLWADLNQDACRDMKEVYEEVRQEILDSGNTQMRNLDSEIDQYDISWNRFQLNLPIKPREDNNV